MENKLETKNIFNNMEYVGFDRAMKEIGEMKLKAVALTLTPSGDGLLKVALTKDVPSGRRPSAVVLLRGSRLVGTALPQLLTHQR